MFTLKRMWIWVWRRRWKEVEAKQGKCNQAESRKSEVLCLRHQLEQRGRGGPKEPTAGLQAALREESLGWARCWLCKILTILNPLPWCSDVVLRAPQPSCPPPSRSAVLLLFCMSSTLHFLLFVYGHPMVSGLTPASVFRNHSGDAQRTLYDDKDGT